MILFMDPTDIYTFEVGIIKKNELVKNCRYNYGPENYLRLLIKELEAWNIKANDLEAVVVVKGPGSATALRTGVTIANAIGFACNIPVIGIQKREEIASVSKNMNTKFIPLTPVYEREAV